jgi:ribonuclease III
MQVSHYFTTDQYLFVEILELVDFNLKAANDPDGCPRFHFFPRFVRELPGLHFFQLPSEHYYIPCLENGISILSMSEVMKYLLEQNMPLVKQEDLLDYLNMAQTDWLNIADEVKGNILRFIIKV